MEELKHTNRHQKCPTCEKMYLYTIKQLEKQIEVLTKMLQMERLSKTVIMPIPQGAELIPNDFFKETGKRGGEARKKQNPDYSAIGKKGAEKRWNKPRKKV